MTINMHPRSKRIELSKAGLIVDGENISLWVAPDLEVVLRADGTTGVRVTLCADHITADLTEAPELSTLGWVGLSTQP